MQHTDQLILSLNDKNGLVGLAKDSLTANHIRSVAANLDKTSNNLNEAVKDLHATINSIRNGKGTLNYLVNDTTLAIKVDTTMGKLNLSLDQLHQAGVKLNENLEALKHNFLFRAIS